MPLTIWIGLGITFVMFAIAGRRFFWLFRLITAGQPAPGRFKDLPTRIKAELVEVGGQKKLLQWSVPGVAHAFTFWGFTILFLTIIEAYGVLFQRDFHIPGIGTWSFIGFLEDFFAVAVLVSLAVFVGIRVKNSPKREGKRSRFFGSHTGAAWLGRENLWLRTATALNWSIWLLLPLGLLAGIFTGLLTQAGLPFAPAFDAMLCLIGLYFFWYHWFTVRAGLQTSFLRAILIVLGINLVIGLLTVAPDLLDYAFGGHS